jgi:hypothetical protein
MTGATGGARWDSWSGQNGELGGRLGFEGKRVSGKLCLVSSGIARANLPAGNTKSAGRDPRRVIAATRGAWHGGAGGHWRDRRDVSGIQKSP